MTGTETSDDWRSLFSRRKASASRWGGWRAEEGPGLHWTLRTLLLVALAGAGIAAYAFVTSGAADRAQDQVVSNPLPREWQWSPKGISFDHIYSTAQTRADGEHAPLTAIPPHDAAEHRSR